MSVYSNQGPLRRAERSASNHSLYTDNSDKSDSPPKRQPEVAVKVEQKEVISTPIQKTKPQQEHSNPIIIISQEKKQISRFPEIKSNSNKGLNGGGDRIFNKSFVNDAAERHALFNEKFSGIEIKQEKAPIPRGNLLFSKSQSRDRERDIGMVAYNNDKIGSRESNRYISSNQGSRWFRSQSLTMSRQQKSFKYLIRHFHKHNSIMLEQLNRYWEIFQINDKNLNSSPYKLSLFDTLEAIKLKMEGFFERRINLENYVTNGPNAEWSQEQFMAFYSNYKKISLQEDENEVHHPYTLKKYKNCVFFGRMLDGKKHEGILHYFNGKCFEGKFKQDQKQFGLQIDEKELYLGNYKKGLRHGQGILKTPQALLVGQFTYGQFTTLAQNRDQSGTTSVLENHTTSKANYQSRKGFEITNASFKVFEAGTCLIKSNVGDIFIGNIGQEGEKSEEGLEVFANGDIYIGRYESDSPEGYGEYYWENSSYYRGQFLSGMRHGRGVWQLLNGDSYEGQYMNDKKNGKGTYVWKNGSKYTGNFENDYRHGYGQMFWQDGRVYKGKWVNGIQKNTIISLESGLKPNNNVKNMNNKTSAKVPYRPSFRTIQNNQNTKKKLPIDKLKSLYNPSYQ